ncbi:hypothetical protein HC891_26585 [Candidatus Gracilibacteria bacterium]|nr:hypothetical protein [Candidatus Gracilibacteria bacterium]
MPMQLTVGAPDVATVTTAIAEPIHTEQLAGAAAQAISSAEPAAPVAPTLETSVQGIFVASSQRVLHLALDQLPPDSFNRMLPLPGAEQFRRLTAAAVLPAEGTVLAVSDAGKVYKFPAESHVGEPVCCRFADVAYVEQRERIILFTAAPPHHGDVQAVVLTSNGLVKRLALGDLIPATARGRTITAAGETITAIGYAHSDDEVIIVTYNGYAIRFRAAEIPTQGANAAGVCGVQLHTGDAAIALMVVQQQTHTADLLVVTEQGKAKRTALAQYVTQARGGFGLYTSSVGGLIGAFVAEAADEVLLLTVQGSVARIAVAAVPQQGRSTAGSALLARRTDETLFGALVIEYTNEL